MEILKNVILLLTLGTFIASSVYLGKVKEDDVWVCCAFAVSLAMLCVIDWF